MESGSAQRTHLTVEQVEQLLTVTWGETLLGLYRLLGWDGHAQVDSGRIQVSLALWQLLCARLLRAGGLQAAFAWVLAGPSVSGDLGEYEVQIQPGAFVA